MERHLLACEGFGRVVDQVGDRWHVSSPCPDWDARGVVEHVIGFHEVLLLRPLGIRAERPRDDEPARWAATRRSIEAALAQASQAPGGQGAAVDLTTLLPMLTTDVLVHTWDLARAVGIEAELEPDVCRHVLAGVQADEARIRASGMFGAAVEVAANAAAAHHLVALLGRDPQWQAP